MNPNDLAPIATLLVEVTTRLQALLDRQMVAAVPEAAPTVSKWTVQQ